MRRSAGPTGRVRRAVAQPRCGCSCIEPGRRSTVMNRWPSSAAPACGGRWDAAPSSDLSERNTASTSAERHRRYATKRLQLPVGLAAAQAVDARMGNHRAVLGAAGRHDDVRRPGAPASLASDVRLGSARRRGNDLVFSIARCAARPGRGANQQQRGRDMSPSLSFVRAVSKQGGETLDDAPLLLGPLLGVAESGALRSGYGR